VGLDDKQTRWLLKLGILSLELGDSDLSSKVGGPRDTATDTACLVVTRGHSQALKDALRLIRAVYTPQTSQTLDFEALLVCKYLAITLRSRLKVAPFCSLSLSLFA
jgi:hypothetical protein